MRIIFRWWFTFLSWVTDHTFCNSCTRCSTFTRCTSPRFKFDWLGFVINKCILNMKWTNLAAIIGANRYSDTQSSHTIRFSFCEPVAMWQHCSLGASNPQPFGYESYTLTNCAIMARQNFDAHNHYLNCCSCPNNFHNQNITYSESGHNHQLDLYISFYALSGDSLLFWQL